LIGLGSSCSSDSGSFRTAVMNTVRSLHNAPVKRVTAVLSAFADQEEACRMLFEGVFLGQFDPGVYKSSNKAVEDSWTVDLISSLDQEKAQLICEQSEIISEAVNLARRLSNEPGNKLYPESFVQEVRKAASETDLKIEVMEEKELCEKGFGCLIAVAQGSNNPPRLCILEHNPAPGQEEHPIVLVGKGVTFDSGGISIKPSASMEEMRADKSGACSVLGAMLAISRLKSPSRVIGVLPLAENLPGGKAQRPGDVVTAYNGTTIEIINTDAEGRLILADAMAWAIKKFKPRCLVDIATLTGACVVALGHHRAGLFSNENTLCSELLEGADRGGEKFWRLPLDDEYKESLESKIADLKNCGDRWGGAITAAKFLESFVGDTPWCHIDMAGTDSFPSGINKGNPPGFGVRTLVEFVKLMGARKS
ncbi:MAG: leucyl aminopeptidase, partial [Anaerolineales bacterium]|nr:leucyl aminopeptidase [Anaerolineales bacterium]